MILKGDYVYYGNEKYKVISVCRKGGRYMLKLRTIDGKGVWYNVEIDRVTKVEE